MMTTGCNCANSYSGFGAFPIYCILCDGESFDFFCFDSSTRPPTFSHCQYGSALPARYALGDLSRHSAIDFITKLRPVCEIIFYFLLQGYITAIHAQHQRSCSWAWGDKSTSKRQLEESTDAWKTANHLAEQALQHAIAATDQAAAGNHIQADKDAKYASKQLKARLAFTSTELEGP